MTKLSNAYELRKSGLGSRLDLADLECNGRPRAQHASDQAEQEASLTATPGSVVLADINKSIAGQLRFQRRWQLLSMTFYVVATVGTLLCTSAAGVLAAMHHDQAAAILAAVSTVLVGTEKSLLFREKWRFHLAMRTKLEVLQSAIVTQGLDATAAGHQLREIMENYAANLPVEDRGN